MSEEHASRPLTRRELLQGAGALALAPLASRLSVAVSPEKPFRFVHITDIHIEPELDAPKGVALCVRKILQLDPRPEFVITGGDHPFDLLTCTRERADVQFKLLAEALKPLEMPVFHTVGNHDVYGWNPRSPASPADPLYGKRMFEERVADSRTYRSFDRHGWHFIILDDIQRTNRDWFAMVDDAQLQWLKADLAKAGPTCPKIVVVHVPLFTIFSQYYAGSTFPSPNTLICQNGKQVHELLRGHNVKIVLQGHTHVVEDCSYLGTRYLTAGSVCGEWWKGPRLGVHPEGFSVVDCSAGDARWTYHPYGWRSPALRRL